MAGGQVMVAELGSQSLRETSLTGDPINRAALLADQASPGGILIDRELRDSIGSEFQMGLAWHAQGGGADGPDPAWRLVGLAPQTGQRPASPPPSVASRTGGASGSGAARASRAAAARCFSK